MKIYYNMIFLWVNLFISKIALAVMLTDGQMYIKCHKQFTRSRPHNTDKLLNLVNEGKLTGSEACKTLLRKAQLNKSGLLKSLNSEDEKQSLKVLKTIQSVHSGWFSQKDFIDDESDNINFNIYDSNEMAYHLTFNLLSENEEAGKLATRENSFRGLRKSEVKPLYFLEMSSPTQTAKIDELIWISNETKDQNKITSNKPKLIEMGMLVGIEKMKSNDNNFEFILSDKSSYKVDISDSLGAGIIGTRPYISLTTTQRVLEKSDGANLSHRSWAKAVYSDLLCRSLPVIEEKDVKYGYDPESKIDFRKKTSCMQCHSSIDPMADVLRNYYEDRALPKVPEKKRRIRLLVNQNPTLPAESGSSGTDPSFHLRKPEGRLYFRNYKGELVDKKVENIKELGAAISETDDLYICLAKKYFHYLTGINVLNYNLNTNNESTSEENIKYRDFVIKLGLDLKKSQSLISTVDSILDSQFYKNKSAGVLN